MGIPLFYKLEKGFGTGPGPEIRRYRRMAEIFEVTIKSGESLKGWHWPAKDPVTNLTIITGMNEYAKRYEPFA